MSHPEARVTRSGGPRVVTHLGGRAHARTLAQRANGRVPCDLRSPRGQRKELSRARGAILPAGRAGMDVHAPVYALSEHGADAGLEVDRGSRR
jgi:hypothetical protein